MRKFNEFPCNMKLGKGTCAGVHRDGKLIEEKCNKDSVHIMSWMKQRSKDGYCNGEGCG